MRFCNAMRRGLTRLWHCLRGANVPCARRPGKNKAGDRHLASVSSSPCRKVPGACSQCCAAAAYCAGAILHGVQGCTASPRPEGWAIGCSASSCWGSSSAPGRSEGRPLVEGADLGPPSPTRVWMMGCALGVMRVCNSISNKVANYAWMSLARFAAHMRYPACAESEQVDMASM